MPRKTRIDAPGAIHHIIIRGIERSVIFKNNNDRDYFITRLGSLLVETSTSCYAWVLMKNHVHLLLRSGVSSLSLVMQRLLTAYARYFNQRYNRFGHLFQNRYKSFLCEEEPYLLELIRYIHLNPLRAGALKTMDELNLFPWSGHSAIIGNANRDWQDTAFVLRLFNKKITLARKAYISFVEKGIKIGNRPDLVGGGLVRSLGGWANVQSLRKSRRRFASDERILGGSDFVASVLKQANERYEKKTVLDHIGIEALIDTVCHYLNVDKSLLSTPVKDRTTSRARSLICHIAYVTLRIKGIDIAMRLNLTPAAISRLATKGRTDPAREEIEERLEKI